MDQILLPETSSWKSMIKKLIALLEFEQSEGFFENETFRLFHYDVVPCDCGFDAAVDEWESQHSGHTNKCFQSDLQEYILELLENDVGMYSFEFFEYVQKWASEKGYNGDNILSHCDCGYNDSWQEFFTKQSHSESCLVEQPNFVFKPDNSYMWWFGHEMDNLQINKQFLEYEIREIKERCIESIKEGHAHELSPSNTSPTEGK